MAVEELQKGRKSQSQNQRLNWLWKNYKREGNPRVKTNAQTGCGRITKGKEIPESKPMLKLAAEELQKGRKSQSQNQCSNWLWKNYKREGNPRVKTNAQTGCRRITKGKEIPESEPTLKLAVEELQKGRKSQSQNQRSNWLWKNYKGKEITEAKSMLKLAVEELQREGNHRVKTNAQTGCGRITKGKEIPESKPTLKLEELQKGRKSQSQNQRSNWLWLWHIKQ